jgi:HPt (histidine-containing phosphotransfer) domain-containing protein
VRPGELAQWLDLEAVGEVCVAVGLGGYTALLAGVLAEPSEALTELLQALDPGADPAGVRAAAHKFKGVVASLGLRRLAATALHWEQAAALAPLDAEQCAQAMEAFSSQFTHTRALCQRMGLIVAG